MKVYETKDKFDIEGPVAMGLGNFDGVHKGHVSLINKLLEEAEKNDIPSMIYTFKIHPLKVLHQDAEPKMIMSEKTKLNVFGKMGVDITYLENFTDEYGSMSPEEFAKNILLTKFNAKIVVVGEDFTFGHRGIGTAETLKQIGEKLGKFKVFVVPLVKIDNKVVSSTDIRTEILQANFDMVEKYSGRKFSVSGIVEEGRKVGRTIGFPTVNFNLDNSFALPSDGVYYTETEIKGVKYKSITNIGNNPTFGCEKKTMETNILDFDRDVYGEEITVYFNRKIREEVTFSSVEELKAQIAKDLDFVRNSK